MIEIISYDPRWPEEFERVAAPLRATLGGLAPRIDHIGSTAVPGLGAKDIIDVQVMATTLDAATFAGALAPLGYALLPPWRPRAARAGGVAGGMAQIVLPRAARATPH